MIIYIREWFSLALIYLTEIIALRKDITRYTFYEIANRYMVK
jgi:hypothetical protein